MSLSPLILSLSGCGIRGRDVLANACMSLLLTRCLPRFPSSRLCVYTDEDHDDSWTRLGTGFCLDDTKDSGLQHLPAMYRSGVTLAEVKALCDKYSTCVALDFGVHQDASGVYGIARFSSAAALDAISEPEWAKWSDQCQDNCVPKITGDSDVGACYVKGTSFQFRILQIHMYTQRNCVQPHARAHTHSSRFLHMSLTNAASAPPPLSLYVPK